MPGLKLTGSCRKPALLMMLLLLGSIAGCSARTPTAEPALLAPPAALLAPCSEPKDSDAVLRHIAASRTREAADAYVRYVLDVRDAFDVCNGQLAALRQYYGEISR